MLTRSAKSKGRRLQQTVRESLLEKYTRKQIDLTSMTIPKLPLITDMYLEADDIKCTTMGEAGVDVQLSPKAKGLIPFDIECKNCETASPWAWMKQAKANTKEGRMPMVCFTRNHEGDIYAMVRLDDIIKLL